MTEAKTRASEMTAEQVEEVLRAKVDWTAIRRARVFGDAGDRVLVFTDGSYEVMDSGQHYRDEDAAGVLGSLDVWGLGEIDRTDYFEGWVQKQEDGRYVESDTGRVLTEEEALEEAVEDGDWGDEVEDDIENILAQSR